MILLVHFIPVLLAASCIQQVRRICIDQHIIVVEFADHIQSRFVLDLYILQSHGRIE